MSIAKLGFDGWFQDHVDPEKLNGLQMARVIAVNKNNYVIHNGKDDVLAELSGKLLFRADSPLDYPAVGDWVYTQYFNDETAAIIHEILPRRTVLRRKTAGKRVEFQLIAANIDTAMIMQSLDANFNIRRLERYLVMINEAHINPVVLLSKSDLLSARETENRKADIQKVMPDVPIVAFSNKDDSGLDMVAKLLVSGRTYCLLGSSGVGKTTLLNNLMRQERFETRDIREKDGKGRHTTARRELILLENGAMIIDTPGMRELGNIDVESGISDTFGEITELSERCRYADCTHTRETGCAVLAAVKDGTLSQERYINFIKMKKESAHYEMSYLEKRRQQKRFGRFIKSAKKNMKHKK
jgi:ribosome biogenesis GTPase